MHAPPAAAPGSAVRRQPPLTDASNAPSDPAATTAAALLQPVVLTSSVSAEVAMTGWPAQPLSTLAACRCLPLHICPGSSNRKELCWHCMDAGLTGLHRSAFNSMPWSVTPVGGAQMQIIGVCAQRRKCSCCGSRACTPLLPVRIQGPCSMQGAGISSAAVVIRFAAMCAVPAYGRIGRC